MNLNLKRAEERETWGNGDWVGKSEPTRCFLPKIVGYHDDVGRRKETILLNWMGKLN